MGCYIWFDKKYDISKFKIIFISGDGATGIKNYTNCFEKKYFELEKARVDIELTNLSLASHYTTIKNGDKLWLDVEFKGSVYAEFVTMVVKNKENPNMKVLVSLKEVETDL